MPADKSGWKKLKSLTKNDGLTQHEVHNLERKMLRVVESVFGGRREKQIVWGRKSHPVCEKLYLYYLFRSNGNCGLM